MKNKDLEILGEFVVNGKDMMVVRTNGAAHVIEAKEYRHIWGRRNDKRWNNTDWNMINNRAITEKMAS